MNTIGRSQRITLVGFIEVVKNCFNLVVTKFKFESGVRIELDQILSFQKLISGALIE